MSELKRPVLDRPLRKFPGGLSGPALGRGPGPGPAGPSKRLIYCSPQFQGSDGKSMRRMKPLSAYAALCWLLISMQMMQLQRPALHQGPAWSCLLE